MFKPSPQVSPEGSPTASPATSGSGTPGVGTPFSPGGRQRRGSAVLRGATTRRRGSQSLLQELMTGRQVVEYGSAVVPAAGAPAMGSQKADLGHNGIPRFLLDPLGVVCAQYGVSLTIRVPNPDSQTLAVQAALGVYDGVVFKPPEKKTKTHKVGSSAAAGAIICEGGVRAMSTPAYLTLLSMIGRATKPEYHEYIDPRNGEHIRGFITRSLDGEYAWFHKIIASSGVGTARAGLTRRPSIELKRSLYAKTLSQVAYAQLTIEKKKRGDPADPTRPELEAKMTQIRDQIFSEEGFAWYLDKFPGTSIDEVGEIQFEAYNVKGIRNELGESLNPTEEPPGVPLELDYEEKELEDGSKLRCVTISDFDVYSAAFPLELILEAIPTEKLLAHSSILEALKVLKIGDITPGSRLHQIATVDTLKAEVIASDQNITIYDFIFAFDDHQENRFQKTGYTEIAKRATRLEANFFSLLNKKVKAKIDAMAALDSVPAVFFNGCIQHGADSANPGETANPVGKDGVVLIHPFADAYGSLVCNAEEYARVCEHYKEQDYIHGFHPSWDSAVVRAVTEQQSPLVFSGRGAVHEAALVPVRVSAALSASAAALKTAVDSVRSQIVLEILTTMPGSRSETELKLLLWEVEKRALAGEVVSQEALEDFHRKKQVSPERSESFWTQYCKVIYVIHGAVQRKDLALLNEETVARLLSIRARVDALNHAYQKLKDEAGKVEAQLRDEPRNSELHERLRLLQEQGQAQNDEMDDVLGMLESLFPAAIVEDIRAALEADTPEGDEADISFTARPAVPALRLPSAVATADITGVVAEGRPSIVVLPAGDEVTSVRTGRRDEMLMGLPVGATLVAPTHRSVDAVPMPRVDAASADDCKGEGILPPMESKDIDYRANMITFLQRQDAITQINQVLRQMSLEPIEAAENNTAILVRLEEKIFPQHLGNLWILLNALDPVPAPMPAAVTTVVPVLAADAEVRSIVSAPAPASGPTAAPDGRFRVAPLPARPISMAGAGTADYPVGGKVVLADDLAAKHAAARLAAKTRLEAEAKAYAEESGGTLSFRGVTPGGVAVFRDTGLAATNGHVSAATLRSATSLGVVSKPHHLTETRASKVRSRLAHDQVEKARQGGAKPGPFSIAHDERSGFAGERSTLDRRV